MKSDMPVYKDDVGASMQKVRAVLQERGMLDGFTSSLKDDKTAAASEEIVNAISLHLEQYLADNASETIDQVSGRIQAKLDDLGESGVSVSDEAIEKIKNELEPVKEAGTGKDDILQKIVEVLNGIGPKIKNFKDFIERCYSEGTAEKGVGYVVEKTVEQQKHADKKAISFPDQKIFVNFIDEIMPNMSFLDDSLQRLQDRLGEQHFALGLGESSMRSEQPSDTVIALLIAVTAEIERAVGAVAAASSSVPQAEQISAKAADITASFSSAADAIGQISAKIVDITALVSSAADAIWTATVFAYIFTALLIMSAASIAAIAPQIALVVALLLAAVAVAAVAATIVAAVLSTSLAVMTILFSASGIIAAPIMAAASAVSTAVTSMVTTVFSMSLAVASALVSAAGTIITTAVSAVVTMLSTAASISASIFISATGLLLQAVGITVGIIGGALSAAVGISLAILSGAVSLIITVLAAASIIGVAAAAFATVILAGALAIVFAALVVVSVAGVLLLAASIVAGAIALVLAGTAVAITLGVAVVAAAMIIAASLAFSLVLAVALAMIAVVVAATAAAISIAIAAFTVGLTILLLFVVAVPLAIVWGIQWVFNQIKKYMGAVDGTTENVDGWMDFFRKNEDEEVKSKGFCETIADWFKGAIGWIKNWPVWRWLGDAWDWIKNLAKKIADAISSFVKYVKDGFIDWWNGFVDAIIEGGKLHINLYVKEFDLDLFSWLSGIKITKDTVTASKPEDTTEIRENVILPDNSPEDVAEIIRQRDDDVAEKVQEYSNDRRQNKDAAVAEQKKKADAVCSSIIEEINREDPDREVHTPPVPVRTPGARKSLEEQEN